MTMGLRGKKIACFLALPHHTRFFIPLREGIRKQGGDVVFVIPIGDYPYEMDLNQKKLPFRYFTDYLTDDVKEKVRTSTLLLYDAWSAQCFKWDGFSRWPLFKQCWFFDALVEEYFCMEKFIEMERPDLFLAHHECTRWGKIIGHLALKNRIPYVTFQEGDYYGDQGAFLIHTEYSTVDLLWGDFTVQWLRRYRCSPDKMIPNGNTHIEHAIKNYGSPKMIKEIRKDINVPDNKKVILFLVDIKYGGITEKEVWQQFLRDLDTLDDEFVCVFKWHPNVYRHAFETITEIFKELYPSAILLYMYDPYRLIAIADYCVALGKTSLVVESIAFGKPIFALPTSDTLEDYYVNMGIAQSVFPPGNWSSLFETIKSGVPPHIQDNVAKYIKNYFYKLDGKSVERALNVMEYVLDVKENGHMRKSLKSDSFTQGRVSVILPSGNDPEALLATLTSLSQNVRYPDWEAVVVVTSADMKRVLAGISGDMYTVDAEGAGLAASYNRGASVASGEYYIFLRPGILYFKDEGLLSAMKDGVAGVPIKKADMSPYCFGICYDFNFTPYKLTDDSREPEAVGGGFVAMRQTAFELVGGFDEEIANHLIEPDLCMTAKEQGLPIIYSPDCLAISYEETFFGDDISDETWRNRVKFFAKWVGKLPKDDDFLDFAEDLLKI